jgi:hypothetical protein
MNMQIALRHARAAKPSRFWRIAPWLGSEVLAAGVLQILWPPVAGRDAVSTAISIAPLVHWRDAGHDWLLVVDQASGELVVYDANDGRPLRRLGAANGVAPIRTITRQGDWLVTTGEGRPGLQILSLPGLQPVTLAGD